MIDRQKYAGNAILRATDFKNGQVVTIDWFMEIKTALKDRPLQPAIKLAEFEEGFLPLNTTNLDFLIDTFTEDEEKWKGKKIKVSLVSTQTPGGSPATGIRLGAVGK